ncbi:MAG: pseudouridine synthase [Chitinivibrionales bacterium]|nr:pseudouridine synthase [Chitinivibrionales bacterium]
MNAIVTERKIRLNKYLASCGLGSRRACDKLIAAGRILVNGKSAAALGVTVNPDKDKIEYKGKTFKPVANLQYFAFHKPRGILVTADDPEKRPTIYDYLAAKKIECNHLKYVGRLDFDSEGLLLLTNDGAIIHALTHPRFHIKKVYEVQIDRLLKDEDKKKLMEEGIVSEGQVLRAAEIKPMFDAINQKREIWYAVTLFEGKKRQIRRMFTGVGYAVKRLRRVRFAAVQLENLKQGQMRRLTPREVAALKNCGFPQ